MKKKDIVSVIIPVYNRKDMISDAVESVLSQTYKDLEVVVIDDGSTDNTVEEIKKIKDPRIVLLKAEHKGPYHARNMGIKKSKGDFIAFLDSDDMWLPEKLEKQMKQFEKNKEVFLVFTDRFVFRDKNNDYSLENDVKTEEKKILNSHYKELLKMNYIVTSSVVVKRQVFDDLGFFIEEKRGDLDYNMWLRVARKYKISYISEPLVLYKVHEKRMTEKRLDRINDKKYVYEIEEKWCNENNLKEEIAIINKAKSEDLKEYFMNAFFTSRNRKKSFDMLMKSKKEVRNMSTLTWFLLLTAMPYSLTNSVKALKNRFKHLF